MSVSTPSDGGAKPGTDEVIETWGAAMPPEPPSHLIYRHQAGVRSSLRELWASRDIIFTLAERDLRAQYKQATLGFLWALIFPVAMLGIFTIVFSRTSSNGVPGIPYPIFAYIGILCWTFFAQSVGTGGTSLLFNHELMSKTQFPRECFPLETIVVTAVNTMLAWIPLVLLFMLNRIVPKPATLWVVPLMIVIELLFTVGVTLGISALIIQMRDLAQVLPMIIQLGLFATPVIWQFSIIAMPWRMVYAFFNPLGPVIDNARRAMLLGGHPQWAPLLAAIAGTAVYLAVGYRLFKRFEVNFADIA